MPRQQVNVYQCRKCGNKTLSADTCNNCNTNYQNVLIGTKEIESGHTAGQGRSESELAKLFPGESYYYHQASLDPKRTGSYQAKCWINGIPLNQVEINRLYNLGKIKGVLPMEGRSWKN